MTLSHSRQQLPAWQALNVHADSMRSRHLSDLFSTDNNRFEQLHLRFPGLLFDFSKQRITEDTLDHLISLADSCDLEASRQKLFNGGRINCTENRAVKHCSLRLPKEQQPPEVALEQRKMERLVKRVRAGQWRGANGDVITDVVNIGVGGSDLGPLMVSHALKSTAPSAKVDIKVHFASSMDGSQIAQFQRFLNPATTLFIISSKSFSTADTLRNAQTAKLWLIRALGDVETVLRCHFVGVSSKPDKMLAWGIPESNQLQLWDWVGGRFSLWSAIGLPIALSIGMEGFNQLLAGAHAMDEHFRQAPSRDNLPIILALLEVWNVNFLGIGARTLLPYDGRLEFLPSYLEQLEMESNGKSTGIDGEPLNYSTCPVIWGEVGPNAQHAFYQLLHQGTEEVACDFIVPIQRYHQNDAGGTELHRQHQLALANSLAQARLLAFGDVALGKVPEEPWRRYRGNKPSNLLLMDRLTPHVLGSLLALYEHKVFVCSIIWHINAFDQWGVEMGKKIADQLLPSVMAGIDDSASLDSSTLGLLQEITQTDQ